MPPDAPFHDPLLTLAYVAALTTKIRLATGIFVLPLRNAFATAKAIATLDQLSQGRVIFGVGIGWLKEEFEAVGMKFEDRALRTREYLELMIELWSKSDPLYKGKTVSTQGMKFMPKTVQQPHPPIVFGGTSEPALKRTVRLGDGWYGIAHSLDEARAQISQLREYARAAERTRPIEITLSLAHRQAAHRRRRAPDGRVGCRSHARRASDQGARRRRAGTLPRRNHGQGVAAGYGLRD